MVAYGIFYTLLAGNQTVASLAAKDLGPAYLSTLPIVAMFAGAILVVVPASFIMERYGRRAGFVIGGLAGAAAGALGWAGIRYKSYPFFVLGGFALGVFDDFSDYLRCAPFLRTHGWVGCERAGAAAFWSG